MARARSAGAGAALHVLATILALAIFALAFFRMALTWRLSTGARLQVALAFFLALVASGALALSAAAGLAVAHARGPATRARLAAAVTRLFVATALLACAALTLAVFAVALAWFLAACAWLDMAQTILLIVSAALAQAVGALAMRRVALTVTTDVKLTHHHSLVTLEEMSNHVLNNRVVSEVALNVSENVVCFVRQVLHDSLAAAGAFRRAAHATEALFADTVGAMAAARLGGARAFFGVVTTVIASTVFASAVFTVAGAWPAAADARLVVTVAVFLARGTNLAPAVGTSALLAVARARAVATSAGLSTARTSLFVDSTDVTHAACASAILTMARAGVASTVALLQVAEAILFVESAVSAGTLGAVALCAVAIAGFASAGTWATNLALVANHLLLHHLHREHWVLSSHAANITATVGTVALTKFRSTFRTLSMVAATGSFGDPTGLAAASWAVTVHTVAAARFL